MLGVWATPVGWILQPPLEPCVQLAVLGNLKEGDRGLVAGKAPS